MLLSYAPAEEPLAAVARAGSVMLPYDRLNIIPYLCFPWAKIR